MESCFQNGSMSNAHEMKSYIAVSMNECDPAIELLMQEALLIWDLSVTTAIYNFEGNMDVERAEDAEDTKRSVNLASPCTSRAVDYLDTESFRSSWLLIE